MRVLIVEDDAQMLEVIGLALRMRWENAEIIQAMSGAEALSGVTQQAPEVILLDLGLPDQEGLDVLRQLREHSSTPIIVITAREQQHSRIAALELGADDYVVKPFSHLELLARVNAVLRRASAPAPTEASTFALGHDLTVDFERMCAFRGTQEIRFTPMEWKLLVHMIQNQRRILGYPEIKASVWGADTVDDTVVKNLIRHLRIKLGDDTRNPRLIVNTRGEGYRFVPGTA